MPGTAHRRSLLDASGVRALVERLREPNGPAVRDVKLHAVHRPDPSVALSAWRVAFADGIEGPTQDAIVTLHQGPPSRIHRDRRHFEGRADRPTSSAVSGCVLDGDETMLVSFPSDHRLRDLRWLCRASHLLRLVAASEVGQTGPGDRFSKRRSRFEVLRYVPEQRAVLRWEFPVIDDDTGEVRRTVSVHVLVDAREPRLDPHIVAESLASVGVQSPTILARPHAGFVLETTVPGRTWSGQPEDAASLGEAVALLHGAPTPDDTPRSGVLDEMDRVLTASRLLEAADTELGRHAFAVADALAERPPHPCPSSMLHGSLRPSRFRVLDGSPGLVGLSHAIVGSAAMDLASLQSDANWDSIDPAWLPRFEQGYASVRPLPEAAPLRWHLAAAMVRTACRRGAEATERRVADTCRWLDQARVLAESPSR